MSLCAVQARPPAGSEAEHPLRRLRRRRGMTQGALAELAGLSCSYISMVERGQRSLTRLDHITAIADVLRVSAAELAPAPIPAHPDLTESASPAPAFPAVRDEVTIGRHARLTQELLGHIARSDMRAAGIWLRRTARDPNVSPWLLLDLLSTHYARNPRPRTP